LRLANVIAEVSSTSGEIEYANNTWYWRVDISESGVENLFRADVSVFYPDNDSMVRKVTGFIGEPVIAGQSNRSWNRGSENSGARE
jgi:hypothetical protein